MDAPRASAYLPHVMLRRLLACLALLTGLAAVGAPINAGVVDPVTAQVGVNKPAPTVAPTERAECQQPRASTGNRRTQSADCRPRRTVIITIPTVQFGADRAFE